MQVIKTTLFLGLLFLSISSQAQTEQDSTHHNKPKKEMTEFDDAKERSKPKFRVIPGPSYDPSIQFGLFVMPMLTYYPSKGDLISPASTSSLFAMYTTNNSLLLGFSNMLYLKEDTWRIKFRGGYGGLNKELTLYGLQEGTLIPDSTTTAFADAKQEFAMIGGFAMRKVVENLYVGLGYNYKKVQFQGNDSYSDSLVTANGLTNATGNSGIEYHLDFDNRDNVFYPYNGYFFSYFGTQYFDSSDGVETNQYFSNSLKLLGFWSLSSDHRNILATKVFGSFLAGNPDEANYAYYGRINGDVERGYQSGRRVDKNAMNIEIEYRYTTPWLDNKIRFMALLGNGKTFGAYNDFSDAEWLPVIGGGVRYAILPYERINVRFDATYSKDGFLWYFGVREAF